MRSKKGLWIGIAVGAALLLAAVVYFLFFHEKQPESYRSISAYEIQGVAEVTRQGMGTVAVYQGMMFENGDRITVYSDSFLQLKLDNDKYALLEPNTVISLTATGNEKVNQTTIYLEQGSIVNRLEQELGDSEYKVNTPGSTMAVRGTVFRVSVETAVDGSHLSLLEVYDGTVSIRLTYPDGTEDKEELKIEKGQAIQAIQDDTTSSFYPADGSTLSSRDLLTELENETLLFLKETITNGQILNVTEEEIDELLNQSRQVTVTYRVGEKIFATAVVEAGSLLTPPNLVPDLDGHWDWDFETSPMTEDTVIDWIPAGE